MAAVIIFEKTCLPDSLHQKIFLVLSGCFLFIGQVLLSLSAKFESAATISFLRKSFDMIFAFGIQILFFQVWYIIYKKVKKYFFCAFLEPSKFAQYIWSCFHFYGCRFIWVQEDLQRNACHALEQKNYHS